MPRARPVGRPLFLALVLALPAAGNGLAPRTFVSVTGSDGNVCTLSAPCRSFNAAIARTAGGGEIVVLDSAGYGPAVIDKPLTIVAAQGTYSGVAVQAGTGFIVDAGTGVVTLRGLTINGTGGDRGVDFISGDTLQLDDVIVTGFAEFGVIANPPAGGRIVIRRSVFRGNQTGAWFAPQSTSALVTAQVERSRFENNGTGIEFEGASVGAVTDTVIKDSLSYGVLVASTGADPKLGVELRRCEIADGTSYGVLAGIGAGAPQAALIDSTVAGNGIGVGTSAGGVVNVTRTTITRNAFGIGAGAAAVSFGDNLLLGNGTDGAFASALPKQ